MESDIRIIFAGLMIISIPVSGSTIDINGIGFPDSKELMGTQLILNGGGSRTYGIFNTTIYVAALYLSRKESNAKEIIDSDRPKLIELVYVYPRINRNDMITAWRISLNDNCKEFCTKLESEIRKFLRSTVQVSQGDRYTFRFINGEIKVFHNNKFLYSSTNSSMTKLLLSTWIGDSPPTVSLKNALLGYQ